MLSYSSEVGLGDGGDWDWRNLSDAIKSSEATSISRERRSALLSRSKKVVILVGKVNRDTIWTDWVLIFRNDGNLVLTCLIFLEKWL